MLSPLLQLSPKRQAILTYHGRFQHVLECKYLGLLHPKRNTRCRGAEWNPDTSRQSHRGDLVVHCHVISKAELARGICITTATRHYTSARKRDAQQPSLIISITNASWIICSPNNPLTENQKQACQAAFPCCFVPQHRQHERHFGHGFVYPAFSIRYINRSILNTCVCVCVCICMQSHTFVPISYSSLHWQMIPIAGPSSSFCFAAEDLGSQLKGKDCCSLNTAHPSSRNAGLGRRQSLACRGWVIAFWKWAAALSISVPSKCSFQSPSAGRMEQSSSAPQLGWRALGWAGPGAGGHWGELG